MEGITMNDRCEYQGKLYTRNNSKWVDKDHMVVPAYLQHILNTLTFQEDIDSISYEEAKSEGDKYKASESYNLAIKYYEVALKKADNFPRVSVILPRITSCYRKVGKPRKVIELLSEAKDKYGEDIINKALLTSVAAAYCDLGEPENAIRCCKWAYKVLKSESGEHSAELSNVFIRANKMIDPDYSPDDDFKEN